MRGTKAHDSILELEPGSEGAGDEELAQAASRGAKLPAYVLWLSEDHPRVQVFANGEYAGEIAAWPDDVAHTLGCSFPTCAGGRGKVDLTPRRAPPARADERTIGRWTVPQWMHAIAHEDEWQVLLDGAGEKEAEQILACLADHEADVRLTACHLLGAIGYLGDCEYGLGKLARSTYERMRELAAGDPDAKVRQAARRTADDLAERLEEYAIRSEFPWMLNFDPARIEEALAALDDPRAAVRSSATSWWWNARGLAAATLERVERKLLALRDAESDEQLREAIDIALDGIRAERLR